MSTLWNGLYRPTTTQGAIGTNLYARTCPTCQGTGINPSLPSRVCPKCNGERRVPVWR